MNPIVHAELSWLAAQWLPHRRDRILVVLAGLAPDLDGLSILGGLASYDRWHHVATHGAAAAAIGLAGYAANAYAVPHTWTLQDVRFNDGGTASGGDRLQRDASAGWRRSTLASAMTWMRLLNPVPYRRSSSGATSAAEPTRTS